MLLASFMVIFKLSDISNRAIEKYPLFDEQACMNIEADHDEADMQKQAIKSSIMN